MMQALIVAAGVLLAGDLPEGDAARAESERLEGTWAIVGGDDFRKGETWVIAATITACIMRVLLAGDFPEGRMRNRLPARKGAGSGTR